MIENIKDNLNEIEYSVKYKSYEVKCKTNINDIKLLNTNNIIEPLYKIKEQLNKAKDQIDQFQLQIKGSELKKTYGTNNLFEIDRILNNSDNKYDKKYDGIRKELHKTLFYIKLTKTIALTSINTKIESNFNFKNASRGGLKLFEILCNEELISNKKLTYFANCELPGNFIVATNHYIKTNYPNIEFDWYANSLMFGEDSIGLEDRYGYYKKYTERWLMGDKINGDVTNIENLKYIEEFFNKKNKCCFYTADGGIDVGGDLGYNDQEITVSKLILGEIICCLVTLREKGNMVIKIWSFFEKNTVDLLIILSNLFEIFKIVKPITSGQANSEIYIVGKNYKGINNNIINIFKEKLKNYNENGYIENINKDDIKLLTDISSEIYKNQIIFIYRNIYYMNLYYKENNTRKIYSIINDIYKKNIEKLIEFYYNLYIDNTNIKPLNLEDNL